MHIEATGHRETLAILAAARTTEPCHPAQPSFRAMIHGIENPFHIQNSPEGNA